MLAQRTIRTINRAVGVGLHSGQRVELTLRPAPVDTGIVFTRVDLPEPEPVRVHAKAVFDTRLASTIGREGARISTIEHIMSACAGLGIDNLYIDLTAEEVPILDGSSAAFVYLLQQAGIEEQSAPRRFVRVLRPIEVRVDGLGQTKWARLEPYEGFKLSFEIDFSHPAVDLTGQSVTFDMGRGSYIKEISRARTFGFTRDVEALRANGLALGGGMDNAIVLDDYKILNEGGLRYEDEFARHKILDAIGDLYVLGSPLLAYYSAYRSGHAMNNDLLRALLEQKDAWEIATYEDETRAPQGFRLPSFAF